MMNGVLFLAIVVAAFGSGLTQRPPDPCRTCEIVINLARHHFNNNVNDKNALKTQLLAECAHLGQTDGAAAAAECTRVVNANIDTIYNDMHANKSARQTCQDIKECPMPTTAMPVIRQKRQQPHTPCQTCEIIIGIAKRHFHNNFNDQNALKVQLDMECQNLKNHGYTQQEADNCQMLIDNNMPAIFMELQNNPTASPRKICQDFQQCPQAVIKRQKRQRPHDPCRTCEIIVNVARHHFHNNITNKDALKTQLLAECMHLGQTEGQAAAAHCTMIVNNNIDKIYADMSTHHTARQTCQDIKECPMATTAMPVMRVKRQRPHDKCRTCEIIVNIARHHFHNNVTDKAALKAQLLVECQHLVQVEGQAAADHCRDIVNMYIDQIFADMSTHKTARMTCQDINECPKPSQPSVLMREKRQRPHDPCRTCEIIINIARHHFHNNVTDQNMLQQQLLMECNRLGPIEGQEAAAHCVQIVNANIAQIFADMSTHKSARQTCQDIKECPQAVIKREKRQRPHDKCRTCEIIINIARFHFHNNVNDQAALQAQLLVECQHLAMVEGQAAADHCTMIVNNNIAQIFADMSTQKSPRQTCTDIKECP